MRLRKDTANIDGMVEEEVLLIARVSDALAHPARINMFRYIMQANRSMQPVCNKDIVENFDYAQATVSQHMKKLVDSGLVEIKKQDKFSYFYANLGMLMQYLNATKKFSVQ
jgi:ArsR family transcriptional regulator, arsenate/arsenite/antimonite-responsive transcriptional repressor